MSIIGSVAQLDRAPDYGSGGLGFESLQGHSRILQNLVIIEIARFFAFTVPTLVLTFRQRVTLGLNYIIKD